MIARAILFLAATTTLAQPIVDLIVNPTPPTDAPAVRAIDFNRDIRPILSDRCFGCHGPDAGNGRKAGLRLDGAEWAHAVLESGHRAIVPGDLEASEAARRITSDDPDEVMPPPELKRPLSADERALMLRWIAEGAEYQPHWAFVAPVAATMPVEQSDAWVRDPLDVFVLAQLKAAGLMPEPEADRATLLRRASLALTGLPPTPEEVDEFVTDAAPHAYERRVDAMLASDRAAEHRATVWLDLARFADTFGYQSDGDSFTWPWRDWLLEAFRSNVTYERFATALIAGDLVPAQSRAEQQANAVASAFNRLHRVTEEGGSISEEFRQEGIADRVSTFGTTFLGLTLECARCHDHKYDPVPTREFYGLAAMFGSIDENGLKSYAHQFSAPPPFVRLQTDAAAARTTQLRTEMLAAMRARIEASQRASIVTDDARDIGAITLPTADASYGFETLANGQTPNAIADGLPATTDRARPDQLGSVTLGSGVSGNAMCFDGDGGLALAGLAGLTRHDPVSFAFWIKPSERNTRSVLLHTAGFYTNDADGSGIELLIVDGRLRWSVIQLWPGSAASIEMHAELPIDAWTHVVATYDGLSSAEGLRLLINGRTALTSTVRDELDGPIATATIELGSRSRDAGFRGGSIDELFVWRTALTPAEAAMAANVAPDSDALRSHHLTTAMNAETSRFRDAQRALAAHLDSLPAFMTMRDSRFAPPTYVLTRGAYDQPDRSQPVTPGAIAAVFPTNFSPTANRLDLARWLFDPANPLAARVEINRLWTQVFGRGLVETSENFGVQGSSPTHPALLDLLASDFTRGPHAFDSKHMLRRLVLSAAFRQDSATSALKRARDPRNELLSRGPSVRVSAEMLRDSALFASGLLIEKLGGPSAKPYQQPTLVADSGVSGGYTADTGSSAHRRSLYSYRKRTLPPPTMLAFDGGSREACQPRRFATNTPLQALALMNDPIFTECARALAERASREANTTDQRIRRAFRLACSREPRAAELEALSTLADALITEYTDKPAECTAICGSPDPELAALALTCTTIFASDAAIMSR